MVVLGTWDAYTLRQSQLLRGSMIVITCSLPTQVLWRRQHGIYSPLPDQSRHGLVLRQEGFRSKLYVDKEDEKILKDAVIKRGVQGNLQSMEFGFWGPHTRMKESNLQRSNSLLSKIWVCLNNARKTANLMFSHLLYMYIYIVHIYIHTNLYRN